MAAKLLRHWPSVGELLETPAIKSLVHRLNQNVVVGRVRAVVDELRDEARSATTEMRLPDVADLAERIARRIMEDGHPANRPLVNATGVLLPDDLGPPPVAEESLSDLLAAGGNYCGLEPPTKSGGRTLRELIEPPLCAVTRCEAALALNSHGAALACVVGAFAAGKEVVVAQCQATLAGPLAWPDIIAAGGGALRQIGGPQGVTLTDYEQSLGPKTGFILVVQSPEAPVNQSNPGVEFGPLAELARARDVPLVCDMAESPLVALPLPELVGTPTVAGGVLAGVDVAITCGERMLGGPECGILLGRRVSIDRVAGCSLSPIVQLDRLSTVALASTIELYRDPQRALLRVPLLSLLATPVENLKLRAERMAAQMASCSAFSAINVAADLATIRVSRGMPQRLPTFVMDLFPREPQVESLVRRLRRGYPGVASRPLPDRVRLDLRSVFPRQDMGLVQAVLALDGAPGGKHDRSDVTH